MPYRHSRRSYLRRFLLYFVILTPVNLLMGRALDAVFVGADEPTPKPAPVRLIIDYGDGVEKHFTALPHKPGMTVLDAMNAAKAHKRGIQFEHKGKGDTALLTKLDDVSNQGTGTEKLNWIYHVNDKMADKGFAIYELKPGDVVRWRYQTYKSPG